MLNPLLCLGLCVGAAYASTCSFSPPASPNPDGWGCADHEAWNISTARLHALRFAPLVLFHPAERYLLTDPADVYDEGDVYDLFYQKANRTDRLLYDPSFARSFLTVLKPLHTEPGNDDSISQNPSKLLHGNSLHPAQGGASNARVFYQVLEHQGAWVYTYNYFYAWNGCNNMAFVSSATTPEHPSVLEFISCPRSVHEADWERVSVVVCPNGAGGKVVAAVLSQHNHNALVYIQEPEFGKEQETEVQGTGGSTWRRGTDGFLHLVVYSALNSHALYLAPSRGIVMGQIRNDQRTNRWKGSDGVFYVDRTAEGGGYFMPNSTNTIPLPGPGVVSTPRDEAWAVYPGWWGSTEWRFPGPSVTCMSRTRDSFITCPDSASWRILAAVLGLSARDREPAGPDSWAQVPYLQLPLDTSQMPYNYHANGGAKQGPRYRPWAIHFVGAVQPPLLDLPMHNLPFRLVFNAGKKRPATTCYPSQRPADKVPPGFSITPQTMRSGLILIAVPTLLLTLFVLKKTLRVQWPQRPPARPSGTLPASQPALLRAHSASLPPRGGSRERSQLLSQKATTWQAWEAWVMAKLPLWRGAHSSYTPVPAFELTRSGSGTAVNGGSRSDGAGAHSVTTGACSGALAAVHRAGSVCWRHGWWAVKVGWPAGMSCAAAILCCNGVHDAIVLSKASLPLIAPVLDILEGIILTLGSLLALIDVLEVILWACWTHQHSQTASFSTPTTAPWARLNTGLQDLELATNPDDRGHTELLGRGFHRRVSTEAAESDDVLFGLEAEQEGGQGGGQSRINGNGNGMTERPRTSRAVMAGSRQTAGPANHDRGAVASMLRCVRCVRPVYASVITSLFLALAGGILVWQFVSQLVCAAAIFDERIPALSPGMSSHLAAANRPVGQASELEQAELGALLFVGSMCVRWRDQAGTGLLASGAIVWALLHWIVGVQ